MNYEIETNPDYIREIRKLENSDPANAETVFNPLFSKVINNIEAVRQGSELNREFITGVLSNVLNDLSTLAFKLAMKGYIDTDGMKQVVVDKIESQNDVVIVHGFFDSAHKKVYI